MSSTRRFQAGIAANLRSVSRTPVTFALVLILPVASIQLWGLSIGNLDGFGLFDTAASIETIGMVTGAVFATAALAGILGLFQSLAVRRADKRLVLSGYRRVELVAARIATVVATAVVVSVVTTGSLAWSIAGGLESLGPPLVGFFMGAMVYGLLGVLLGTLLTGRLEGSLVLVALADVSAIVASGLFGISDGLADIFPLSHSHDIVLQGIVDGSLATGAISPAVASIAVAWLVVTTASMWMLPAGGEHA